MFYPDQVELVSRDYSVFYIRESERNPDDLAFSQEFLTSVVANIRNCDPALITLALSDEEKRVSMRQVADFFAGVDVLQQRLDYRPHIAKFTVMNTLGKISHTPLVWDPRGVLHNCNPDSSDEQNARILLLSIPNVRLNLAEYIVELMSFVPCSGRKVAGMLPAAMLKFPALIHPKDKMRDDYSDFCKWVVQRATYQWPSPQ